MRGRHRKRAFWATGPALLIVVLSLLAAGTAGSTFAAYRYEKAHSSRILPGIHVADINVGGMTVNQATRAVDRVVNPILARSLVIRAGDATVRTSLSGLGVRADVQGTVEKALSMSKSFSWESRAYHRLTNSAIHRSFWVRYRVSPAPVNALVAKLAGQVARPARDASFQLVDGQVSMQHSQAGHALDTAQATQALSAALQARKGASITLPIQTVQPNTPDSALGKTIVVDKSTNTLRLYDGFTVIRTYPVATAMFGFYTPNGTWQVVAKIVNPSWHNPAPNGWGKGEPLVIPPGPGNPLGTRALALNASGILIHGTPEDFSIGHYASHGCIRMHISQSEALFPLVPTGTPVLIVGSPPWGNTIPNTTPGA